MLGRCVTMNHLGTLEIETKRLHLRKFTERDVPAAFNNWTSDGKVTEFLRWPSHKTIEITENILKEWMIILLILQNGLNLL